MRLVSGSFTDASFWQPCPFPGRLHTHTHTHRPSSLGTLNQARPWTTKRSREQTAAMTPAPGAERRAPMQGATQFLRDKYMLSHGTGLMTSPLIHVSWGFHVQSSRRSGQMLSQWCPRRTISHAPFPELLLPQVSTRWQCRLF